MFSVCVSVRHQQYHQFAPSPCSSRRGREIFRPFLTTCECLCARVRLLWILQKVFRSKRQGSQMLPGNVLIYGACLGLAPLSDRQCVTHFRHPDLSAMILSSSRMNACECGSLIWNISFIAFISMLSGCCVKLGVLCIRVNHNPWH